MQTCKRGSCERACVCAYVCHVLVGMGACRCGDVTEGHVMLQTLRHSTSDASQVLMYHRSDQESDHPHLDLVLFIRRPNLIWPGNKSRLLAVGTMCKTV